MNNIILASQSPRRRELLTQIGIAHQVVPSKVIEESANSTPTELVTQLSRQKAFAVGEDEGCQIPEGSVVIGADTVVVLDQKIMGKPKSHGEAAAMLTRLQGRTHSVYTGVTLYYKKADSPEHISFVKETKVTFYPMNQAEIERYVNTKEPMDKAGAYGIQGLSAAFIERIEGDYNNVVGLPVAAVYQKLKERGWL